MYQYNGKSINRKIVIGPVYVYEKKQIQVKREKITNTDEEILRFENARKEAQKQLAALADKARQEVGEAEAAIFDVHNMMLDDDDFCDSVINIIRTQKAGAEYAVAVSGDNFAAMFEAMDDDYMKARSADIMDIAERVVSILIGNEQTMERMDQPIILAAKDLAPSETVQMDKSKLLGFVTELGSSNSHTAILARTMDIPAIIGVEINSEWNGKMAILDGYSGTLIIAPSSEQLADAKEKLEEERKQKERLKNLKGKETVSKSGKKIHLYANIGNTKDTLNAITNDAEGIGLFRSEFLYLESNDFPTEQEQFIAYKTVTENMAGKKVIIRTLDIGADKQADYFGLEKEENPALGYRAIRICLTREEIFRTQLRAILRASAYGQISIMFPMIISVEEVQRAKEILCDVKKELTEDGLTYQEIEIGIMIETPAAVMMSRELAKEVDFFSIGTNDLTQYTLAIDRQNPKLDVFYDAHHPAIIREIEMVVENGHKENCWVGICGELGADTELTEKFLRMGIDELSVSPAMILKIREQIQNCN